MKLKHPDAKQTIEITEDLLPYYESQGWERVEAKSKSDEK